MVQLVQHRSVSSFVVLQEVVKIVNPLIIGGGEALKLRAKQGFTDDEGV